MIYNIVYAASGFLFMYLLCHCGGLLTAVYERPNEPGNKVRLVCGIVAFIASWVVLNFLQ